MSDNTARKLNNSGIQPPQTSLPGNAAPETIPEIIRNFRATFGLMSKQLEDGNAKDNNGNLRKLNDLDVRGFLMEVIEFTDHIREWKRKKTDLAGGIQSLDCVRDKLQEVKKKLNAALELDSKLSQPNLNPVPFGEGSEKYFDLLAEAGSYITDMLDDCFSAED